MSGIVGMYERSGAPVDRTLLQALAHFLSYCGPDARETWFHGSVGLAHTMLRTTRASQIERQPASLAGRLWITADARIDCRDELLGKLIEREGGKLAGPVATDSDLILRSYSAWGADCVQHLRGDFAFAIWDAQRKLLFCARDHFGIKPFYYSELGELFLFSNTLDCLRQHPEVSSDLNDAAIGDFLLFGLNCDVATTTFRDIRRLPPAHSMTVSSEGLRIQRYWSAPTEGRIRYQRPEDYVEHFQILLQAAVSDRMAPDRTGILVERRPRFRHDSSRPPANFPPVPAASRICAPTPWSTTRSSTMKRALTRRKPPTSSKFQFASSPWITSSPSNAGTTRA